MKKLLLTCLLLLGIGASSQIVVNEGFEGTTTPTGFTYATFSRSTNATRLCTGAAALNSNFWSSTTTGNVTYASTASNGTALAVSFNYNTKEYSPGEGVGGTYKVEYSVNGGTSYTQIGSDIVVSSELACTPFTGTVATGLIPANANFRFRIRGLWTSGDFYFNVDDLVLQQVVSCNAPSLANITAVNTTNATLNWTAAATAPANGYDVYYSTSPTPPNGTTTPNFTNITGTSVLMTPLMPATTYYAFVRSNCSAADQSNWITAPSFLTPCVVATSFTQNFDTVTTPALPPCWAKVGTFGSATTQTGTFGSTPNVMYFYAFTAGQLAVVKMPSVNTLQLGTYRLKFKLRANSTAGGKIEVGYLTNPADDTSFVVLNSFTANSTTVADNYTVNAITAPAGVQDLAFRHTAVPANSVLIDDVVYELTPSCAEPSILLTSNVSTTTVDLSWTAPTTAPANGYEVYYSTTNVAPTAATTPSITGITGTNTTVGSLLPSTTYYMYVRSNCSSTEKSPWTNTGSFTTACIPITTLPWSENFDAMTTLGANILPPCWISQGTQAYTSANAASNTYNDPRSNPNYVTVYYPTGTSYLWSPGFTLTAGQSYDFTFYWVGDGYSGWEGDVLVNSSQSETGATQVGSSFISGATTTASTYTKSKSIFIPTTTGTYYFAVKSFASSFAPYYMGFDDFSLEISSTCSEPTALSSSNLTTTSADVSWTAPAIVPAFGYEVYYNTTNVAPTAATVATISNITTTNTTLTPLNSSSTYYFWVRSVCSATEKSSWSNVGTFNTACATVNIPYTQDFSSAIVPALPNCTSAVNNGTGNIWETSNSGINGNSLRYGYSFTDPADTWFFTPGMSMTAGNTYYIGYKYAGTSYDESMKVAIGTTPDAASMTTVINDYPSITGNAVNNVVDQMFTPTVSGVYYLGFQAYSAADQNALYVDDITVTATPLSTREISVKENLLTVAPNPFKDIIRISDVKDVVSISIVDLSGRLVKTMKPAREIQLGDLKTGMYLINLKMKDGSVQTVKAIKK